MYLVSVEKLSYLNILKDKNLLKDLFDYIYIYILNQVLIDLIELRIKSIFYVKKWERKN